MNSILNEVTVKHFSKGEILIKEGDEGNSIMVIKEGEVECRKDKTKVRSMVEHDFLGESSLLFNLKRSLDVIAMTSVTVYNIESDSLRNSMGEDFQSKILESILKNGFKKHALLAIFASHEVFDKVFKLFEIKHFKNGELAIQRNEQALSYLLQGNLINKSTKKIESTRLQFSGLEVGENDAHKDDLVADSNLILLQAPWLEIISLLSDSKDHKSVLKVLLRVHHIKKLEIFQHLPDSRLIQISEVMLKKKFSEGMNVFKQGDEGSELFLIHRGKVTIVRDGSFLRELEEGNCFGEIALFKSELRSASAVVSSPTCIIYVLKKEDLFKVVDSQMTEYLVNKMNLQDSNQLALKKFFYVKSLGQGKFGKVCLVHNKNNFYAIKSVEKEKANKQKILINYFKNERLVMLKIDHPFIVKLVRTFKDEFNVFYLMEHIHGISFRKYLDLSKRNASVTEINFYIGSILLCLDYLSGKAISHRDLKPDNIMIDVEGRLKLIDFGTATPFKDLNYTITGTPHYIAPEILKGKGYTNTVDYWSVGIICFEMCYGKYPFGFKAKDPMEVYKSVIKE